MVNPSCQAWTVGERVGERMTVSKVFHLLAVCVGGLLVTGCVMSEKYEAEKARGLNFQRLLAQEEKRTAELDAELKKARRQLTEAESKNRSLSSELQTAREQLAQSQEEAMALRETTSLGGQAKVGMGKTEDDFLTGFEFEDAGVTTGDKVPLYHEVLPGETLFRLSRTYGVKVDEIKAWNNLGDDLIEVGQQLVVGYQ